MRFKRLKREKLQVKDMLAALARRAPPPSIVLGAGACGKEGELGGCDFEARLMGKCCDQKPCRMGAGQAKISGDGAKIVYYADLNFAFIFLFFGRIGAQA